MSTSLTCTVAFKCDSSSVHALWPLCHYLFLSKKNFFLPGFLHPDDAKRPRCAALFFFSSVPPDSFQKWLPKPRQLSPLVESEVGTPPSLDFFHSFCISSRFRLASPRHFGRVDLTTLSHSPSAGLMLSELSRFLLSRRFFCMSHVVKDQSPSQGKG